MPWRFDSWAGTGLASHDLVYIEKLQENPHPIDYTKMYLCNTPILKWLQ